MEGISAEPKMKLSVEDYLEFDEAAEHKSEYHDGEIFPVVDASEHHAGIAANLGMVFGPRLRTSECRRLQFLRVRVSPTQYVYPDFAVVCGKSQFAQGDANSLINPKVIVEILSPSTADFDHGGKFELYRNLQSFEEYLLVSQDEPRVKIFRKQSPTLWSMNIVRGLDETVHVTSLGIEFPLNELYEGVNFTVSAPE